ncbi:MAG: glycosyltransferase [Candidatus Magnetoovum sp. WYHC-5]|nr:glycosyltransferase [Candidatus Magnetoovum sp. WYHC-5]
MQILMIGALSIKYINDSWVKPLRQMYECTFVDVSPMLSVYSNGFHEAYIKRLIKNRRFDYLFFYADAINVDFTDDFFYSVKKSGIPIITFYADDEPEIWYKQNEPYDHRFSLIATHSKKGLKRRQEAGKSGNFLYLSWGFNPEIFKKIENTTQMYDVVYIGENLVSRENPELYLRDGYIRQKTLCTVYNICKKKQFKFKLFGPGWERHPILKECAGGMVSNEQMVRIYNEAKVVFNPGFAADNDGALCQTKLRHFEVAGCGAFQLVNYNSELAELFDTDREICFYNDDQDIEEKLLFYVKNDKKRQEIALAGWRRALSEHKIQDRLQTLFNYANTIFPLNRKSNTPTNISITLKTFKDIPSFYKDNHVNNNSHYIHFLPNNFKVQDINYTVINKKELQEKVHIIGVRTFLQLSFLHDNRLQRKKENMTGVLLNEKINKGLVDNVIVDYIKKHSPCLEDEKYLVPIFNYILPSNMLEQVSGIFLENNIKDFDALPICYSGLIVNDIIIDEHNWPAAIFTPKYLKLLSRVFQLLNGTGERVLIYGGRGVMADNVFLLLKHFNSDVNVIGVIDRSVNEPFVSGYPVYKYDDIESLEPELIVIAAGNSGASIYKAIKHLSSKATLLPLYDLNAPVWQVLLY